MMQSFSSLDFASDFVFPIPARFSKPVRQIKFYKHNTDEVELVLDTAKENLCPFKVRYIVLKTKPEELLKNIQLYYKEGSEDLSLTSKETEQSDMENLKTELLKKFSDLSKPLQESVIPIYIEKTEFLLRHFDNFVSSKQSIVAFIESHNIKFIYRSDEDKNVLAEEFENVNDEITCHTLDNLDKRDILKLQLEKDTILNEAAKIEIGVDFIKMEGFPIDVALAKFKIFKATTVNFTLLKQLDDDVAALLRKDIVVTYCNQMIKQQIPNNKLLQWKIEGDTVFVVGRNEEIAKTGLQIIENCHVTFNEDFSGLTLPDQSHLVQFKNTLQRDFQCGIVLNDTDSSSIVVTTTINRLEQARMYMDDFKTKFTVETKAIKVSAEKAFYLEASQEDLKDELFSGNSLSIEKGAEKDDIKITAYQPEVSLIEQKAVVTKSFGLNNKEFKRKLQTRMQDLATETHHCKLKIQDTHVQVLVKDERIEEQQVDVIVNSVSGNFDLSVTNVNNVAYSISKAAGSASIKSVKQKYPSGVGEGEVAFGDKGKLQCKELYHVVLKKFTQAGRDDHIKNLRQVIDTCLKTAEGSRYISVAFPAIAAGVLCYPHTIVAETILDCIVKHVFSNFETTLKTFIIVIPIKDINVKKAFTDEIEKRKRSLTDAEEDDPCLIEHPQWLCEWKVDIVGETEEEIQDFVKIINTTPM